MMITKTTGRTTLRKWMPLPVLSAMFLMISCSIDKNEMSAPQTNTQEEILQRKVENLSSPSPDGHQEEELNAKMLGQKGEPNLFQQTAYLTLKSIDGNNKFYDLKIEETNSTKFFRLHVDGENDETTPQ